MTDVYHKAIEKFGVEHQLMKGIEEMTELSKEYCKAYDGKAVRQKIIEEMADVEITMTQAKIIFKVTDQEMCDAKNAKLMRLMKLIQEG